MSASLQDILAGPWEFHAQGDADEYCLLTCKGGWVIAFRINGEIMTADQVAIAKMVAAAPKMKAALKALAIEAHKNMVGGAGHLIDDAWEAIAEAEGKR